MLIDRILQGALLVAVATAFASGQPLSPPAQTSVTIAGKNISIKYSAPSVRGRKIFSEDGILKNDATYPVWRAGANEATLLETSGNLTLGDLKLPAGKYSLYVLLDKAGWKLIVNKQTGQSGMEYDKSTDVGRVAMNMGKPPAMVERFKITLSSLGGNKGRLLMEWENTSASADFTVN
jgi:hypothetical protein